MNIISPSYRRAVAIFGAFAATMMSASAATLIVTKTSDNLAGSLRQAIQDANAGDTIVFQIPAGSSGCDPVAGVCTITLTSASSVDANTALVIAKDLTIDGAGARIVIARNAASGAPKFRVFSVTSGAVTLANLTIANGNGSAAIPGGGVYNAAQLTVRGCAVTSNFSGVGGGGLHNAAGGTLRVSNCTLYGNTTANAGRAIENQGTLFLDDSTVSQNPTGSFTGNAAVANLGSGPAQVRNTIIAGNEGGAYADVAGSFISDGYNFIGDPGGPGGKASNGFGLSGSHDQVGTNAAPANPSLAAPEFNEGSAPTMRPQSGSSVIDEGSRGTDANNQPINFDQRGQPRPIDQPGIANAGGGDGSDIGAVEVGLPQSGATLTVTTIAEHNDGNCTTDDCTLREAVNAANANADANTITFAPGLSGTISLTTALPNIIGSVAIQGPGANLLTVQRNAAAANFRVFTVAGSFSATISGLTIANGNLPGGSGGGIYNSATLTLTNDTISGNVANAAGNGGGVFNDFGTLTINNCTFSGNSVSSSSGAGSGGAIFNKGGTLNMTDSTIFGNTANCASTANDSGGGIFSNVGNVTLTNTTISGNSGDLGGGVRVANGAVIHVRNTIIALNTTVNGQPGPDVNGDFVSDGHNFIGKAFTGSASTGFTDGVNGDQVGAGTASAPPKDPKLDTLKNNGGPTNTTALLSGSTCINAGDDTKAPSTDQRGYSRTGISDIGAYEFNGTAPLPPTVTTAAATNITSTTATLNATVNPNSFSTTVQFTTDFGQSFTEDAGSGTASVNLSANVTGLAPSTQYHFNVLASNAVGITQGTQQSFTTAALATPTPAPAAQLLNLSTRKVVGTGDNVLIGGFIVVGTDPKKVIVRGLGPSILVNGALADPVLEIHRADSKLVAGNNDWRDSQEAQIIATGIPPANNLESAIVADLQAAPAESGGAAYTALLAGNGGTTGIGLLEIYDLATAANARLANISTRGFVGTGDDLLIGGFIPGPADRGPMKVLIRALGPSLEQAGVSGALQDPVVELHDGNGNIVATNNDWREAPNAAEIQGTGIPPSDDRESAILTSIPASNSGFTAVVRGADGLTGVSVVEIYALQ